MEIRTLSAVILAGGRSRRMGQDKAWMEWNGRPMIAHALAKARELGVAEVLISGRVDGEYSVLGCRVLWDREPGLGPLGGIERALEVCSTPLLLVLAVDLPHLSVGFLRRLAAGCDRLTGVVPEQKGELEPLVAIYPKRCHALARDALIHSRLRACDFAAACRREGAVRRLAVSGRDAAGFVNWNRPQDLQLAAGSSRRG